MDDDSSATSADTSSSSEDSGTESPEVINPLPFTNNPFGGKQPRGKDLLRMLQPQGKAMFALVDVFYAMLQPTYTATLC